MASSPESDRSSAPLPSTPLLSPWTARQFSESFLAALPPAPRLLEGWRGRGGRTGRDDNDTARTRHRNSPGGSGEEERGRQRRSGVDLGLVSFSGHGAGHSRRENDGEGRLAFIRRVQRRKISLSRCGAQQIKRRISLLVRRNRSRNLSTTSLISPREVPSSFFKMPCCPSPLLVA
jgi:hypothetical protein